MNDVRVEHPILPPIEAFLVFFLGSYKDGPGVLPVLSLNLEEVFIIPTPPSVTDRYLLILTFPFPFNSY